MKYFRYYLVFSSMLLCSGLFSQEKTIANLTEAFRFETSNCALFTAYADQARKEGFPRIATFFTAVAKMAEIHAGNFKTVLGKMGATPGPGPAPGVAVSTQVDLEEAFKSVRVEAGAKYAEYMDQAVTDGAASAVKALRWAKETHQLCLDKYTQATDALINGKVGSLPDVYWICPKCGNLYNAKPEETCGFCGTARKYFIRIND